MNRFFLSFTGLLLFITVTEAARQRSSRGVINKMTSAAIVTPSLKCFFVINGEFTFDEAKQACEARNAGLATLRTMSEDQYIRSEIEWDKVPGFRRNLTWVGQLWIGLERISPQPWTWVDGSPLHFSSWLAGEGNTSNDDHECIITRKFGWINSYHCDATVNGEIKFGVGALCQKSIFEAPPEASEMGSNFCGSKLLPTVVNRFAMPTTARKTFFTVKASYTWEEARWACNARGGTLAILRNQREDQFVRENIDIDQVGGNVWIGLRMATDGRFEWIDGSAARYSAWFQQDIAEQMPESNRNNCTVLKRWQSSETSQTVTIGWAALDCSPDVDSTKNWPGSPSFPIGALCESIVWL